MNLIARPPLFCAMCGGAVQVRFPQVDPRIREVKCVGLDCPAAFNDVWNEVADDVIHVEHVARPE